jgi:hypothetical protein
MKKEEPPITRRYFNFLIKNLQAVEYISGFLPLLVMIIDIVIGSLTKANHINYEFFGSYLSIYGCLLLIFLLAIFLSLIKEQALGKDNSVNVYGLSIPKNTTILIQNSYAVKIANKESVLLVVVFVFIELVVTFLFGVLVSITIFKSYLWGYANS